MPKLFLSYSRKNSLIMEIVRDNLLALGFDVWVDIDHLTVGTPEWEDAIEQAVIDSDALVLLMSPPAKRSKWVRIELQMAHLYEKPVFPVFVDGDRKTAVPPSLLNAQYCDIRGDTDYEAGFRDLVDGLASTLGLTLTEFQLDLGGRLQVNVKVNAPNSGTILVVGGDVSGELNVAGGDVRKGSTQAEKEAASTISPAEVFQQAADARRDGDHQGALDQLEWLQEQAPDFLPEHVTMLIVDSREQLGRITYYEAYRQRYQQIYLLALDPLTRDDARSLWDALQADFPDIDDDPDELAERLVPPEPELTFVEVVTHAVLNILPAPIEWCEIPGNEAFQLLTDEGDKGTSEIAPFLLAKHPVTYEQFQVFIEADDGFYNDRWWQGLSTDADHRKQPGKQYFSHDQNLPRENVSWYDAVAFCRWLSVRTRQDIRLPAEWEWQWAAQGPDGRHYPWGDRFEPAHGNIASKLFKGDKTTPVTQHPHGASFYGVMDMSGNVWEWCLNEYDKPQIINLGGGEKRVVRGGSFIDDLAYTHVSGRSDRNPHRRSDHGGFRLCAVISHLNSTGSREDSS